jgi:hypothetical protein
LSPSQRAWLNVLAELGYYAAVPFGEEEALERSIAYLDRNIE